MGQFIPNLPAEADHLINRRKALSVGSLSALGLSVAGLFSSQQTLAQDSFTSGINKAGERKAKRCLLLYMWGAPAHQDLFDMKPDAPAEIRGEFQPAPTAVPGTHICSLLPKFAQQIDKISLIRSVTHTDNNHSTGSHWMLTGHQPPLSAENFNARLDDYPHIGSVLSKVQPGKPGVPAFVALPEVIATTAGAVTPGQGGGFLGKEYDPFRINQHPNKPDFQVGDLSLPADISPAEFADKLSLLQQLNQKGKAVLDQTEQTAFDKHQQTAVNMLSSPLARKAFDLSAEKTQLRDAYGRGTFGQSLLLARRLLEHDVKLVTVYWHREKPGGTENSWDTHDNNFPTLKNKLIPQVDQPLATLLTEMQERGLLEDTLIVWMSEFGRTPRINKKGGRDHWGACNTIWMASGGINAGQVYGASDNHASKPVENPVTPADVTATIFHLLGVDYQSDIHDRLNRPFPISSGKVIHEILS